MDWCKNAYILSHYYLSKDNYEAAKHHIASSRFILEKYRSDVESKEFESEEDKMAEMEKVEQCSASIDRCWGKYAWALLQTAKEKKFNEEEEVSIENIEETYEENVNTVAEFPSVEIDPAFEAIPTKIPKNFEDARAVFLPGQRYLTAAKKYFTMDEHCMDHTEINQDLSALHKFLVVFETDPDRKFKIHKRRVELLEGPLNELSPTYYLLVCRQLMFELGEVYESMMDAKYERLNKEGTSEGVQTLAKINATIDKSVGYFTRYLDSLKKSDGEMPGTFSEENIRPVMMAYFHLARLWDKYVVPELSEQKLKNKVQQYMWFRHVVDYCKEHPDAAEMVSGELSVCEEMVKLLPIKIERMRMEMRAAQGR